MKYFLYNINEWSEFLEFYGIGVSKFAWIDLVIKKWRFQTFIFLWSIRWIYQIRILNTKAQIFFNNIRLFYTLSKRKLFSPSVLLSPLFKVYKKVIKFSFTQQKIFCVLLFIICIWYLVCPTDRSFILIFWNAQNLEKKNASSCFKIPIIFSN